MMLAAAAAAFALAVYPWRPKDKPLSRYILIAAALYIPTVAADFLPLIWALFHADPDASLPFTIAAYTGVVAAAIVAARRGYRRSAFAAASALPIRWVLYAVSADIFARVS